MHKHAMIANKEKGQSLMEFAFGMVILLVLLVGVVDGGRALFTYLALRDAAQEGAIYGSIDPDAGITDIKTRVLQSSDLVADWVTGSNITVQFLGDRCIGNAIRVTVKIPDYPITMPFLGAVLGSQTVPLSATVTDTLLRPYACP
jgi:Flp pilus assembly protein TadG